MNCLLIAHWLSIVNESYIRPMGNCPSFPIADPAARPPRREGHTGQGRHDNGNSKTNHD